MPVLVAMFLLPLTSCDDFDDLNVDPNNPVAVPASNLVTQAEFALNNLLWSRGYNAEWSMLMVQHWAQNEYTEEGRFDVDGNSFDGQWVTFYASVLQELKSAADIINADEGLAPEVQANQLAIITILEVHAFHNLIDAYGDAPYTQSLNSTEFPLPAYDTQESIYTDLVAKLRAANSSITAGAASFASGDIVYGGDMGAWKKMGNSLLMRIAMRMSNVNEAAAKDAITTIDAANLITDNADNAMFNFDANPDIANPLFVDAVINVRDDFSVTTTLVDICNDLGDPRLAAFAATNSAGEYQGMPPGIDDNTAFNQNTLTSRPSEAVRSATAPAVIIDAAEVHFMLAEAYQRGMLTGDAAAAYAAGVTASMNYWGITDQAAIDAYVAANPYDAANYKECIGTQKWLAFYMNGPQAWAEWRRLGQPVLTTGPNTLLSEIPVRLPYPISEQTRNATELGKVDGGDPNDISDRLWWDVD